MCHSERPETGASSSQEPAQQESGQSSPSAPRLPELNNVPAGVFAEERGGAIPGRGDLRISLTSGCNLKCAYCHNEGQKAPWLYDIDNTMMPDDIKGLLDVAARYGVESVKFSGGDPGIYSGLFTLLRSIEEWRASYPGIKKWGICTSGTPFLNPRKFDALVASHLDNISIGIDSVEPEELSKPSSPFGVPGRMLIDEFVTPLMTQWKGRRIKFDTVFTGDKRRTLNVIREAIKLDVDVSIIEVNGVMGTVNGMAGTDDTVRREFLELISETTGEYDLQPKLYEPLNEIYLYDSKGNARIRFYQDHCRDLDCGNCRKIHLRVSPTAEGWGAVPCFLRAQSKTIPLVMNGQVSGRRFEDAIMYNGQGPQWFENTPYGSTTRDD
jgi:molybdenum cofactor biosynthesis enzyme MoaA